MDSSYTISVEESPRPEDVDFVRNGLRAYNCHFAKEDFAPLVILLRAPDQTLVGGLLGETYWGWLHVGILWLDAGARRHGYGRKLLRAAEEEALRRGCRNAHLDTMSFQALPFYEKQGYTVWGVLDDLPPGHSRIFLRKTLQ